MMHQHLLPTALAALIWAQAVYAGDVRNAFTGRAQILVLNSTSFEGVTREQKVGCLNAHGMLTADDCAVFTREDDFPNMLSTKKGKCTFRDPNMPTNRDSIYGRDTHAWSCGTAADERSSEVYYTVNGFDYPFVCNGNLNCWYDILAIQPGKDASALPVWPFHWGGQQVDVPAGHSRVLWLWEPVPKEHKE